eukprot:5567282-Prymnesium_polylepis.1
MRFSPSERIKVLTCRSLKRARRSPVRGAEKRERRTSEQSGPGTLARWQPLRSTNGSTHTAEIHHASTLCENRCKWLGGVYWA